MEIAQDESGDRINLMTLHAAKGLEFDTVFLPGWEEGLFPSQRTMDENGLAGLEEERRLAYVGLTRAKKRIRVSFAANRRVHGSWQSALPSRFITELPQDHVDMVVDEGFYGGNAGFRDNASGQEFASTYDSPGWRRAQANRAASGGMRARPADDRSTGLCGADERSHRHPIRTRRTHLPPEIRLRYHQRRRRQQTHRRFR